MALFIITFSSKLNPIILSEAACTSFLICENYYEIRFVLDQHALLEFYSASSLKQQSAD
jgi:hypothetical protein